MFFTLFILRLKTHTSLHWHARLLQPGGVRLRTTFWLFSRMREIKQPAVKFLADGAWSCLTATTAMASDGGGPVSADISLCLIHGPGSGQPFLCGHQSSGDW